MSIANSFTARSPDGTLYTLYRLDDDQDTSARRDHAVPDRALPRLRTADGRHISRLGKGRYQVIETGVLLESDDPNAD